MKKTTIEVPISGMDCADCTRTVHKVISELPGVESTEVYLASEKAIVVLNPELVTIENIRQAVSQAGYRVPEQANIQKDKIEQSQDQNETSQYSSRLLRILGLVAGAILFVVVAGEWLDLFEFATSLVPWPVWLLVVLIAGWPIYLNVWRAARQRRIISHTLMTVGVIAACLVGEWATAVVVVFFMRVGDAVERYTTERARDALRGLSALAPQEARLLGEQGENVVPIEDVQVGDIVIIRPGEKVPVDGVVIAGQATINQATITGESMPVEAHPGSKVFAASFIELGSLRVRTEQVGLTTTFGHVVRLVEEAESNRADVERVADRFSTWYLPVVLGIAILTFLLRRDPLAAAAVLVVACSCAFALATPIAILASVGAAAGKGILIKGGAYLELLEKASVLLIDKTGTLTWGRPQITEYGIVSNNLVAGESQATSGYLTEKQKILQLAASAERYSEHPLAEAVRQAAILEGLPLLEPENFEATPGIGVRALVDGHQVAVGSHRILVGFAVHNKNERIKVLESQGYTLLFILVDQVLRGYLAFADTLRPEVPDALKNLAKLGINQVVLLTGDNPQTTKNLIRDLPAEIKLDFQANLLPEDKIAVVRNYQSQGNVVIMVGDGVNDAPALAQADVGIAMGAAGSDIAIEVAKIALMREDWRLVPEVFGIARRTMRVVRGNIAFTALYNLVGLSLAALGYLPPIFAAALQSVPDLLILGNSSRLIRQKNRYVPS